MQPPIPTPDPVEDVLALVQGPLPDPQTDLALRYADKLTHGATPALVEEIRTATPVMWLEQQLQPDLIAEDVELEATLATFPTLRLTGPAQREASTGNAGLKELQLATVLRGVRSNRHLLEMMVGFWHDHFNIGFTSARLMWFAADHDRAVRAHALGTFRELLRASARSAAMMLYLDNHQSRWPAPNENYAREVMELHTLGVDGGYDEDDVAQVALALTGWGTTALDRRDTVFGFAFHPEWHYDEGPLQVMDWTSPAMGGEEAVAQGESLLDHLARHRSTARFLSAKLVRRVLGEAEHPLLVEQLADVYLANDTAIGPWLRALVTSQEFLGAGRHRLRRPAEQLIMQLRALDPTMLAEGGHQSQMSAGVRPLLDRVGHELFTWATPDGFPDDTAYWAATGSVLARWNATLELVRDRVKGIRFDVDGSLRARVGGGTVGELVDGLAAAFLQRLLDPGDRDALLRFVGTDRAAPASDIDDQTFRHVAGLVLCVHAAQLR